MLFSNREVPYVNYDKGIVVMNALQDYKGEEEVVSMNDCITFGVFGADGEELYLEKHQVHSGTHELTFIVDGIPEQVGIDPYYNLIDKNPNDNVISIE